VHPEYEVLAARCDGIDVEVLGDELVLYDRRTQEAHLLNAPVVEVWHALQDPSSFADLGARLPHQSRDQLTWAIAELQRVELVEPSIGRPGPGAAGVSRRQLLRRMGLAAVAIPAISTIFSAQAASAAPACGGANAQCNGVGGVSTCCSGRTCIGNGSGNQGNCCGKASEQCSVNTTVPQGTCCSSSAVCVPSGIGSSTGTCSG
jgi:hypothetical protein